MAVRRRFDPRLLHVERKRLRSLVILMAGELLADLPNSPRLVDLRRYFRAWHHNATARLLDYYVEEVQRQCTAMTGARCSITQAREYVAEARGVSLRQLVRQLRGVPMPTVRGRAGGRDAMTKELREQVARALAKAVGLRTP